MQWIERLEVLLLIAAIVAMVARRLNLPYTVGLTLAGVALAFAPTSLDIAPDREIIFVALLPPLIFEAAFHMQWRALRRELPVVLTLATLGVLLAAGVAAAGIRFLAGWSWPAAILLAVLISATDPVSVIATLKESGVKGRFRFLVEAESLFNDGTVAVLFGVALAAATGGGVGAASIPQSFVTTVVGGIVCGALVAGAVLLLAGRTEDHLVEITFTTVAAYGSFLLAERLHLSGVLATLTAGIIVGNTGSLGAISDRGRKAVESFWEYIGFVVSSLVFLLIGIRLALVRPPESWWGSVIIIAMVTLGRAVAVYTCCALFRRSACRVPIAEQHVLFWGGLRGALALALALGLPSTVANREEIISAAFTIVVFSVIVQGLTVKPLLRKMDLMAL